MIATQGDTWDLIAYREYGREFHVNELINANPSLSDVIIFEGGEEVVIPDVKEETTSTPWR